MLSFILKKKELHSPYIIVGYIEAYHMKKDKVRRNNKANI